MKKNFISFVALTAAVAAVFSCSRKEIEIPEEKGSYQYRFEVVDSDTRALFNDEGVFWEADKDKVGVIIDANDEADIEEVSGTKYVVLNSGSPIQAGTTGYAYYPYQEGSESASANVYFNPDQRGGAESAMPMAGVPFTVAEGATNGRINFLNLGAIIDFRVYSDTYAGETVESVTFQATGTNTHVAGTAKINLTSVDNGEDRDEHLILNWENGTPVDHVTVSQEVPVSATKDLATTPMYLFIAPGTYDAGTITVTTNAAVYTFTITKQTTLNRNKIKKFNMNLDNAVREAFTKTYNVLTTITESGTYLIASLDTNNDSVGDGNGTFICSVPTVSEGAATSTHEVFAHIIYQKGDTQVSKIETSDSKIIASEVEFIKDGSSWLVQVKSTGQYLYCPNENYKIAFSDEPNSSVLHTVGTKNLKNGNFALYHSGSEKGFQYKSSGSSNLLFYKLDASQTSKSQTLYFAYMEDEVENVVTEPIEFEYTSGTFTAPILKGNKSDDITYDSSNTNIAGVDNTGAVTLTGKPGEVTITANVGAGNGYAAASASYQINVSNSEYVPTTVKYYKASALETPSTSVETQYAYLIVSASDSKYYALQNNEGALDAAEVSVSSNNQIDIEEDETLLWTATAVSENSYGTHTLTNNGAYFYRNTSNSNAPGLISTTPSSYNYYVWKYNGEDLWNQGSSSYYLRYNNGWSLNTSSSDGNAVLFTARQPVSVFFDQHEFTWDLTSTGTFSKPNLTTDPAGLTVKYGTSDDSIATVSNDGTVSFNQNGKTGSVTITASVAPTGTTQGAQDSYVINVTAPHYYTKVTSTSDITNDGKYIIVNESNKKAFNPILNSSNSAFESSSNNIIDVSINGSDIVGTNDAPIEPIDENCQFTFTPNNNNYYIKSIKTTYYLKLGSSNIDAQTGTQSLVVTITNGALSISRSRTSSSYYLYYNSYFRSGTTQPTGFALYKYVNGVPKQSQTVEFADGTDKEWTFGTECELNGVYDLLTLNSAASSYVTTLEYEALPEGVAEIVDVDGVKKVKIVGAGTTTIKVTAPEDATHYSASDSFQLTVNKKTQTIVFVNAAGLEWTLGTDCELNGVYDLLTLSEASSYSTELSFVSDNQDVAVIVKDGGKDKVKIVGDGSTTITGTAEGDATHNSATASFTLKVVDPDKVEYVKVASTSDFVNGGIYILVQEDNNKAFKPVLSDDHMSFMMADASNAVDVTIANSKIVSGDEVDKCQVVLFADGSGKYDIKAIKALGYYLYLNRTGSNNNYTYMFQAVSSRSAVTIDLSNGNVYSGNCYMRYTSGAFTGNSTSNASKMSLYRLTGVSIKPYPDYDISFSATEASYNLSDGSFTQPTLTKPDGVTAYYRSSNNAVSVDPNTGEITNLSSLAEGTTAIITAYVPETAAYAEVTAFYTLTVIRKSYYYTKVTKFSDIKAGDHYIFVNDNGSDSHAFKFVLSSSSTTFEQSNNAVSIEVTGEERINHTSDLDACLVTFDNISSTQAAVYVTSVSKYFMLYYNPGSGNTEFNASTDNGYRATIEFDTEGIMTFRRSTSRYLVFDGSFKASSSKPSTSSLALYKRVENSN